MLHCEVRIEPYTSGCWMCWCLNFCPWMVSYFFFSGVCKKWQRKYLLKYYCSFSDISNSSTVLAPFSHNENKPKLYQYYWQFLLYIAVIVASRMQHSEFHQTQCCASKRTRVGSLLLYELPPAMHCHMGNLNYIVWQRRRPCKTTAAFFFSLPQCYWVLVYS